MVNLRRNLQSKHYIDELNRHIKRLQYKFSPEIFEYFECGIRTIKIKY